MVQLRWNVSQFLWRLYFYVLAWTAHPSMVTKCCSLGTSFGISNNTIIEIIYMTVYIVCWCRMNHCIPINKHSIDSLRNVLRWSHAPSSKLVTEMDFCSYHVSLGKVCMYFHTWKAYRRSFHENEMQCTSLTSAITHCLAGKLYHTFWGLEERWKLLNISTSILTLAV